MINMMNYDEYDIELKASICLRMRDLEKIPPSDYIWEVNFSGGEPIATSVKPRVRKGDHLVEMTEI